MKTQTKVIISVAATILLILIVTVGIPMFVLGTNTYFWSLTHAKQVKMIQADYTHYDNSYSIPKE